jgi:hypothetical protein
MTALELTGTPMDDPNELEARGYERGVRDVIALAMKAAAAMPRTGLHPSRHGFASAALEALAKEAQALIPRKEAEHG